MLGVLIYTASGDSEGSLGGVIEQADPDKLYPIFIRAMETYDVLFFRSELFGRPI
ncbi:hypothetical protein [Virgibacillus necropolis]|uniref:hypothetical protein n=1 Tax=Virgibacillus necropolis TaxID=163877 RepID=UPI0018751AA7|nr:hypothetical protein [Virgibacillus necropolis]